MNAIIRAHAQSDVAASADFKIGLPRPPQLPGEGLTAPIRFSHSNDKPIQDGAMNMRGFGDAMMCALLRYPPHTTVEAIRNDRQFAEDKPLLFSRHIFENRFEFILQLRFRETGRIEQSTLSVTLGAKEYLTGKSSICSFMQPRYGHPRVFKSDDLLDERLTPITEQRTWEMPMSEVLMLTIALEPKHRSFDARMELARTFPGVAAANDTTSLEEFFTY